MVICFKTCNFFYEENHQFALLYVFTIREKNNKWPNINYFMVLYIDSINYSTINYFTIVIFIATVLLYPFSM